VTANKDFKALVRARAKRLRKSYASTRRDLLARSKETNQMTLSNSDLQNGQRVWVVVHTEDGGAETLARQLRLAFAEADRLEELGGLMTLPRSSDYVLVHCDPSAWPMIRSVPGVTGYVGEPGVGPTEMTFEEVRLLLEE